MTDIGGQLVINLRLSSKKTRDTILWGACGIETQERPIRNKVLMDMVQKRFRFRGGRISQENDFFGPAQVQIQPAQHVAEAEGILLQGVVE